MRITRYVRFAIIVLLGLAAMLLGGGTSYAVSVVHVPLDYPTIQQGIDAALPGDTVLVAPGTYYENIDFRGKAITLQSEEGPELTTINGGHVASVVTFASGEGLDSVLSGFTLENGYGFLKSFYLGGGIAALRSSPTITNNIIADNDAFGSGGGIGIESGSPLVRNNVISGNEIIGVSGGLGGGVAVVGSSSPQLIDNVIAHNSGGPSASGGGVAISAAGSPLLEGNVIEGNHATQSSSRGGGIWIGNTVQARVVSNLVFGNTAEKGGGIAWSLPSSGLVLVNNTIASNHSTQGGDGIFADYFDMDAQIFNNLVVGTEAQSAVLCGGSGDGGPPVFRYNNAYSPGAPAYAGICGDQTGMSGNISADPLFANPAAGDYHLRSESPSIDAGNNGAPSLPPLDFDAEPRPADGDGDGVAVVDMGVDEFTDSDHDSLADIRDSCPLHAGPSDNLGCPRVEIDIKPLSKSNPINPSSRGRIPVAILSSADFDASSDLDLESLTFGATGNEQSRAFCSPSSRDVDGDGLPDRICHFRTPDADLECSTEGVLRGLKLDGTPLRGTDTVRVVPKACPP